jgi:hypothetical protein
MCAKLFAIDVDPQQEAEQSARHRRAARAFSYPSADVSHHRPRLPRTLTALTFRPVQHSLPSPSSLDQTSSSQDVLSLAVVRSSPAALHISETTTSPLPCSSVAPRPSPSPQPRCAPVHVRDRHTVSSFRLRPARACDCRKPHPTRLASGRSFTWRAWFAPSWNCLPR